MRVDISIWLIIAIPILTAILLYILQNWRSEYKFYRSHGWDYSVDNPAAMHIHKGEDSLPTEGNRWSNSSRMIFGYPLIAFGLGIMLLVSLFFVYRFQVCDADGLTKCGINVENGGMIIKVP